MIKLPLSLVSACLVSMVFGAPGASELGHEGHDHGPAQVHFVPNLGQWDQPFLFRADAQGATAFLERDGVTWVKLQEDAYQVMHDAGQLTLAQQQAIRFNGHAWKVRFVGGSVVGHMSATDQRGFYHNYFLGNDRTKWRGNVPVAGGVHYGEVWQGIDVRFHGDGGNFKYDVLLSPGADAGNVVFAFDGLEGIELNEHGQLVMRTSVGEVVEMAPVAFYSDGAHEAIDCAFQLHDGRMGFRLGRYDRARPVTIDPVLIASTLSGCSGASNYGHCATYDDAGNIYTGARNFGPSYPATLGAFQTAFGGGGTDMSFSKYNPDGSNLIWASYLGGNAGENPHSMIVNSLGELCVMGSSASTNFPTTAGAYDTSHNGGGNDMTITVFSANAATLTGSTFIGGSGSDGTNAMWGNYGEAYRGEIYLDASDNVLVAGFTESANFPTTAGAIQTTLGGGQDGVVLSVNRPCSSLLWSTFMGGSGDDGAFGLRLSNGSLFVCGSTESANFATTPGAFQTAQVGGRDGWVAKMDPTGTVLQASTYYGTTDDDRPYFLDTDNAGNVWVYGQSDGTIPIQPVGTYGAPGPVFVAKFASDLATVPVSSTIGGGGFGGGTVPVAFLVDHCDHIYISGFNSSTGLPLTANSLYSSGSFYLAAFDVDFVGLLFGTYYGGSHVDGGTSRFDKDGIIYQGVCSGMGSLQTTAWAWATNQTVGWDIGVFKIDFQVAGVNAAGASNLNQGCAPIVIDFSNTSTGTNWIWDFGDGSPLDTTYAPSHLYTTAGVYNVTLIAFDSLSCNLADTVTFPITIGLAQPLNASFTAVNSSDCTVFEVSTTNSSTGAPLAFIWDMGDGTQYTDTNVVHVYATTGTYDIQLLVYDPTGCSTPDSVLQPVTVLPPDTVSAAFAATQVPNCNQALVDCVNQSVGVNPNYLWNMGDGTTYTTSNVDDHLYPGPGQYTITLIAYDTLTCNGSDTVSFVVDVLPLVPIDALFSIDEVFDCQQLVVASDNQSSGTFLGFLWDMGDGTQYTDTNVVHTYSAPGTYDVTLVVSCLAGCFPNDTMVIQVVVDPIDPIVAAFTTDQVGNCTSLTLEGINLSSGDSVAYTWDMGDGTTYSTTDVTHVYTAPGTYTVELLVEDLGCGNDDSLSVNITVIDQLPIVAATDGIICPGLSTVIAATGTAGGSFLWSNGSTNDSLVVQAAGSYWVQVNYDGCTGADTVEVIEAPVLDLESSRTACPGTYIDVTVPYSGTAYLWEDGSTGQTDNVWHAGGWEDTTFYAYQVWDAFGCVHEDSVQVLSLDADARLFAPNAFTPDGDGVNDVFTITGYGEKDMELLIFNRWGEQIFSTTTLANAWNGQYNGQIKQDVYVYKLKYNGECSNDETSIIGHVTVVK